MVLFRCVAFRQGKGSCFPLCPILCSDSRIIFHIDVAFPKHLTLKTKERKMNTVSSWAPRKKLDKEKTGVRQKEHCRPAALQTKMQSTKAIKIWIKIRVTARFWLSSQVALSHLEILLRREKEKSRGEQGAEMFMLNRNFYMDKSCTNV